MKEELHDKFLLKSYEHLASADSLLTKGLKRDFISRFYYGYISILKAIYPCKGNWHDINTYRNAPEHIRKYFPKLKAWRIRSDYEFHEEKTHLQEYMEGELLTFMTEDLLELISEGLIPELKRLVREYESYSSLLYLIIKELEEISVWLKAQRL